MPIILHPQICLSGTKSSLFVNLNTQNVQEKTYFLCFRGFHLQLPFHKRKETAKPTKPNSDYRTTTIGFYTNIASYLSLSIPNQEFDQILTRTD